MDDGVALTIDRIDSALVLFRSDTQESEQDDGPVNSGGVWRPRSTAAGLDSRLGRNQSMSTFQKETHAMAGWKHDNSRQEGRPSDRWSPPLTPWHGQRASAGLWCSAGCVPAAG